MSKLLMLSMLVVCNNYNGYELNSKDLCLFFRQQYKNSEQWPRNSHYLEAILKSS